MPASAPLFRAVFAESLDAIVVADDEARYVEANPAACALFGLSREELLQRRVPEFAPPSLREEAERAWREFRSAGYQKGEFQVARPDGSTRIVEYSAKADVVPGRHLSILRDVTEARALQRDSDRMREVFIGALGHDLRNPLSAILINAEILRRFVHAERTSEPLERIVASAARMARMISDLLDFTRVRQGSLWVDRQPVDVRQITSRVLDELSTIHPGVIEADLSPVAAPVDADRFAQVVSNLVGNAIRHGDGGAVRVRLREEPDGLTLDVHNTGNPIPPEASERIFDPFHRSSGHGVRESLGLGLFIVRQIVAAHDGQVGVESETNTGTTFRVRIPFAGERRPVA
jgi:phosphoserine phosphatase RsbU/P